MNRRFLILLLSTFLALVLSDRTEGKECMEDFSAYQTEELCEASFEADDNTSEYGLPRQNSYSAPLRNLQSAKRATSSVQSLNSLAIRAGKAIDINIYLHTLTCHQADYSGIHTPGRLLISLRKLII